MKWHYSDVCIKTKRPISMAFSCVSVITIGLTDSCCYGHIWRTCVAVVTFDGTLLSPQQNTLNTLEYQVYINNWRWVIIVFKPAYTFFFLYMYHLKEKEKEK